MEIVIQLVMKILNRLAINIMNSLPKSFWHHLGSIKIVNGCTALPISEDLIIGHIIPCFEKGYKFMEISK